VKYKGVIVDQLAGSMGGLTASRNQYGGYFRQRVVPVNPNTPFQQAIKQAASECANAYFNVLTDAQRSAWETYAANTSLTGKDGNSLTVKGPQMYNRTNVAAIAVGLPRIDSAPTLFYLAPTPDITSCVITVPTAGSLVFDDQAAWCSEDNAYMLLYLSRPQNGTLNFYKGPYRHVGAIAGDSGAPITSPQAFTSPFPYTAGQRGFLFARVRRADGRVSDPFRLSSLAV